MHKLSFTYRFPLARTLNYPFLLTCLLWLIYAVTATVQRHQGLSFFDASEFATHIQGEGIPHAPGYPLYIACSKISYFFTSNPFDAQFCVNLLSSLVCVIFLFFTLTHSTQEKSRPAAIAACISVGFLLSSGLFQLYVRISDVFMLNLALLSVLAYLHRRFQSDGKARWVLGIGFVYGLGVCHHHTLASALPATLLLFIQRTASLRLALRLLVQAFIPGFGLGLFPLLFLFIQSSDDWNYTYYLVRSWKDLLFVIFRTGYGTFRMTASHPQAPAWNVASMIGRGLLTDTRWIGLGIAVLSAPFYLKRKWKTDSSAVFSILSILTFFGIFCSLSNFDWGTLEGKNTFLRYLTVPVLLLLYPAHYGWTQALKRFETQASVVGTIVFFTLFVLGLKHVNFQNYPLIDYQVQEGFKTIERITASSAPSETLERRNCVIFALSDPFHFGGRYYNEFKAKNPCYFFSLSSVITSQFLSRAEALLVMKYLGGDYVLSGKTRQSTIYDLFQRLLRNGFRLFVFYVPDLSVFGQELQFRPVGNIAEVRLGEVVELAYDREKEFEGYLKSLQALLDQLESKKDLPIALSEDVLKAPFMNLSYYKKSGQLPSQATELEKEVFMRAQKFLSTSLTRDQ